MSSLTVRQRNAIKWKLKQGYRPVIGGIRDLSKIELQRKDNQEIEYFDIDSLLSDYDQARKEDAKQRAAARRMDKV